MNISKRKRLGDMLIDAGLIRNEQLDVALEVQKKSGNKLGEILISQGFVSQEQIMKVLETQLGIPRVDLKKFIIDIKAVKVLPENVARKYEVLAIQSDGIFLTVVMSDPLNYFAIDDIKMISKMEIKPVIAPSDEIKIFIDRYYAGSAAEKAIEDYNRENKITERIIEIPDNEVNSAPTVRFVNSIIEQAARIGASDIHIEPGDNDVRIRFRIDGVLQEIMRTNKQTLSAVTTRIKILSDMNIAEKRVPQDGRIETKVDGNDIDLRISTLPTIYGEKIVIRLLNKSGFLLSKTNLGLKDEDLYKYNKIISNPYGIILVTGPTGSGKSTTLYSMLNELNDDKKNIISIEDPVEYTLSGINQVNLNIKAGLTFASGLRSILRQDPDIIMIGEIRDSETADIAIRSSLTGHLVLSTLHTNDAPGAITRLIDMNIEPFLVSSSLVGIIAQRLIRKVCKSCTQKFEASEYEKRILNYDIDKSLTLHKGSGCPMCNGTGYRGRIAIFEIINITKGHKALIDRGATTDEIRDYSIKQGMLTLRQGAVNQVLEGITTMEELSRVTYEQE